MAAQVLIISRQNTEIVLRERRLMYRGIDKPNPNETELKPAAAREQITGDAKKGILGLRTETERAAQRPIYKEVAEKDMKFMYRYRDEIVAGVKKLEDQISETLRKLPPAQQQAIRKRILDLAEDCINFISYGLLEVQAAQDKERIRILQVDLKRVEADVQILNPDLNSGDFFRTINARIASIQDIEQVMDKAGFLVQPEPVREKLREWVAPAIQAAAKLPVKKRSEFYRVLAGRFKGEIQAAYQVEGVGMLELKWDSEVTKPEAEKIVKEMLVLVRSLASRAER